MSSIYESWIVNAPIAHRGLFTAECPENSLAAFKNAMRNNLAIELDVTSLADGTVVVFHDSKLARMTGKDGFISNCKYEEISELKLAKTNEKIPTLEEALEFINGKVPVLIEIKNYGKVGTLEKEIWKILQSYTGEYAIASFNPYSVEWFKINAPTVKRGQIASFFKTKEIPCIKRFSLKRMRFNKKVSEPHFIIYASENMPNKYLKKYQGVLPIVACTVKSIEEENRLHDYMDNFLFDSFTPSIFAKEVKEEEKAQ